MKERCYIVRLPDGSESQALSQSELLEMAMDGRLTADAQLRSSLVPRWAPADSVPFLKEIYDKRARHARRHPGVLKKVAGRLTESVDTLQAFQFSLLQGRFHYTPAPVVLRVMAGLTDLVLIVLYAAIVAGAATAAVAFAKADPTLAAHVAVPLAYIGILLYLTLAIGLRAQTIGQWFWGIMVIGSSGKPVFLLRALCFSLGLMLAGILTPLVALIMPANRSVHDLFTKTRVVRIRVTGGAA